MDTTRTPISDPSTASRRRRLLPAKGRSGQAIVEFALVSMAFFAITLGTIDLGRAVFQYNQLTQAVREGARFGKIEPPNEVGIKAAVMESDGAIAAEDITRSCTGGCYQGCSDVTVTAEREYVPIVARIMGIDELGFTLSSSATVEAE